MTPTELKKQSITEECKKLRNAQALAEFMRASHPELYHADLEDASHQIQFIAELSTMPEALWEENKYNSKLDEVLFSQINEDLQICLKSWNNLYHQASDLRFEQD